MAALPSGVTLQQIDGGPNYYSNNGFTYAGNAGWDNPNFFAVGVWYGMIITQADADRWHDLGLNTAFRTTGNTVNSILRANGIWAIEENGETPNMGSETVGLLTYDEPVTFADGVTTPLSTTPNSIQDGRFWYINNTWNFIEYQGLSPVNSSAQVLNTLVTTPNGTQRHIDQQSVDIYWFAGGKGENGVLYQGGNLYNLGRPMTPDEAERGSNYGDMIDWERAFQGVHPAPIAAFIEVGGPYTEDTSASDYITPPELNWAVWSSIIHGAREIIYFNHTFAGPAQTNDALSQKFYQTVQPGQTISMYDQVKATDALIAQLAPVLNSPSALGFVTVSPTPTTFNGIEVTAKYYNGQFYIFSDTRDSETQTNIPATFTVNDPNATSVTVVNENRTIPVTNGTFTDTFAKAWTVHIYQVNDGSGPPPSAVGSVSINDFAISEGNSGTKVATFTVTRSGGTAAFDLSFATSNGTATVADSDYVAASGTLNFAANENTKTISVTINGDTKVESNETFNVLLSNATNGATISDGQGVGTITNDDGAAVAGSLSINDVTISEGNSGTKAATFTVTRSGGTAAFDVNFATSDGTSNAAATVADSDYIAANNTLHFGANENTKTISVTINGDTKVESNETFNVNLSNATNGATISDPQGVGTITNDDGAAIAGSVSINDVTISEGNSGTKVATFTVTRSGGTAAFAMNFATSDGTARVADNDYVAASGTLNFGANENTETISVTINGDTKVEANQTFNVVLSNATNGATISDGQGVGTITNDDAVDTVAPAKPAISAFSNDTGIKGDGITNDHTLALTGAAEANSTVSVYDGTKLLGTAHANSTGAWSYPTGTLLDATHSFTATATDAAGNVSAASPPLAVTVATPGGHLWKVAAQQDFSSDGGADLLWTDPSTGALALWTTQGTTVTGGAALPNPGASWHVVGANDFNGDNKSDILWQGSDGTPALWLMDGTHALSVGAAGSFNPGPSWQIKGSGDFNSDGRDDILWQGSDGTPAIWLMDGMHALSVGAAGSFNPGPSWQIKGSGDFNGDGRADILWQGSDGTPAIWLMDGTKAIWVGAVGPFNPGANWHVEGTGDFNGDAKADILWQDDNGAAAVWTMNGTTVTGIAGPIGDPSSDWHLV